ncbi:hypothetical protein CLV92_10185 [Kineococcus xinjiangensis]|uniref:Uncharacterized protein n=1 Tax=Kineococcus xinjiangensis TaxID=512762 RepID=A0A2S6IVX7_9ACTN|nr:hypothetical protein [Kineococcus xinjiangensis]PPK98390.1 hypothetical protein CLV92_10185 [Kineococcus xinjiangensis]
MSDPLSLGNSLQRLVAEGPEEAFDVRLVTDLPHPEALRRWRAVRELAAVRSEEDESGDFDDLLPLVGGDALLPDGFAFRITDYHDLAGGMALLVELMAEAGLRGRLDLVELPAPHLVGATWTPLLSTRLNVRARHEVEGVAVLRTVADAESLAAVARDLAGRALRSCTGRVQVGAGLPWTCAPADAADVVEDALGHGRGFRLVTDEEGVRRVLEVPPDGRVVSTVADSEWRRHLAGAREDLLRNAAHLEYGRIRAVVGWTATPVEDTEQTSWPGRLAAAAPFRALAETVGVADVFAVQVVREELAARVDAAAWRHVAAAGGMVLVEHRDPAVWFEGPQPDPAVLEAARHDWRTVVADQGTVDTLAAGLPRTGGE